jgi:hypothetical protein
VLVGDPAPLYGEAFAAALRQPPRSAFVADGSEVVVRRGVRIIENVREPLAAGTNR